MTRINTVLIANRGEIACRIIKTLKANQIKSVAIYTQPDANSRFVKEADTAIALDSPTPLQGYLDIEQIITIAKKTKADAIHPGYGFLSENAAFAAACSKAKIIFVGAPTNALEAMGIKDKAKTLMSDAGVPVVPGFHESQAEAVLKKAANQIGYPIIIKPVAGGGGKGMKTVFDKNDFVDALASAKREAKKSFGNDDVLIEKFLQNPRHIEVQVLADNHGHCIHLFERDCSIQRRHQKIIEEAPAPNLSETLRKKLGETAVKAALAINYQGAGTIEFLLEGNDFYFMEMNTRLQVEHPVTEMITGVDLVDWQLSIAEGKPLTLQQSDLAINGHAIEARLYAEDPQQQFLPSTGTIAHLKEPLALDNVRIDSGLLVNDVISPDFDPMLAKIIAHGSNRKAAIKTLQTALQHYELAGVTTNNQYLQTILTEPDYQQAKLTTHYTDTHHEFLLNNPITSIVLALGLWPVLTTASKTELFAHWRLNAAPSERLMTLNCNQNQFAVYITKLANDISIRMNEDINHYQLFELSDTQITLTDTNHTQHSATLVHQSAATLTFIYQGVVYQLSLPSLDDFEQASESHHDHSLVAPITATVTTIFKKPNESVKKGDRLLVLEAMKMEHTLHAPFDTTIKAVHVKSGEKVDANTALIDFIPLQ